MCVANFFRDLNADYGTLIQSLFIAIGFVFTVIQLKRIKLSSRSNAIHQIATSNRELRVLDLNYSSTSRLNFENLNILRSLMTNHCAYLWEQYNLKAISDDWWRAIKWDMQQTFLNDGLRKWWNRNEVQECYSIKFREFIGKEILHTY